MPVTIPSFTGGQVERYADEPITFSVKSGQTVRGGRLVEITASKEVQEAGATSLKVIGLALHDADPAGDVKKVVVACDGTYQMLASGAITAGDRLMTDTGGRVKTMPAVDASVLANLGTSVTQLRGQVGIAIEDITDATVGLVQIRLGE